MRNYLLIFMLFTTILFASKQELTVTILPQKYFVQKIVKDKFRNIVKRIIEKTTINI